MKDYSYFFDILDLCTSFVAAFDDAFVFRYDAITREAKEKISVRYIFGPKHRVLFDLNDRAKTLTLPVVTIEHVGLSKDNSRIANKNKFLYRPGGENNKISKIPMPIPVNLEVNVSIIAYFKEDIDQIVQNFVVNCNPYVIVPTKIPEVFGMPFLDELRNEIQWSGDVSYNNPKDLSPDTKWRISADTTFTIKGWMFKSYDSREEPIYVVRTDFHNSDLKSRTYTDYYSLSDISILTDTILISAYPEFTNIYYASSGKNLPVYSDLDIKLDQNNGFLLLGKRFGYNNTWYLSGDVISTFEFEEVITAKHTTISAYKIPEEYLDVPTDNIATVNIPMNTLSGGNFTIVTANSAGWTGTDYVFNLV